MKVILKITRFDPEKEKEPHIDSFEMEAAKNMSVLEALFHIMENVDGSLSYRYSCRGAVCGSCAMYINGKQRLACQTLIGTLKHKIITIEPLPHLKVIKDLVVDMTPFFDKYESIKPYMICHGKTTEKEIKQTVKNREKIDEMTKCILCGACFSACTMAYLHSEFLGPAALTKAYRFVADSRDEGAKERLELVGGENGVLRCHTLFNCAEVCPKEIVPTYSIQKLKGRLVS
ncbi:MAG: succinate dehydrogenase iron-sulfur subunit [Candidatus Margulisiibacteriota bacterium]